MADASYIASVSHTVHEMYSPNLHKWLSRESKRWPTRLVTGMGRNPLDGELNWLMVGWRDDDGWFMGSAVRRILTAGLKATVFAHPPCDVIAGGDEFWADYLRIGRCALDRDHTSHFRNAAGRFTETADERACNWCGDRQVRHRWSQIVPRESWQPASAPREGQ